jgi:hypothetical protein
LLTYEVTLTYLSTRIVAVHGLCGDSDTTWSSGGESWLKETLPSYLAHARVSTFSYKLDGEGVSAADIDQKAQELLDQFDILCGGKLADGVSLSYHHYLMLTSKRDILLSAKL